MKKLFKKIGLWFSNHFGKTKELYHGKRFNSFLWFIPLTIGTLVSDIIDVVTEWVTAFWELILDSINSAIALVYNPLGETIADKITFIGYLALFGLAIGIVKLGMGFVMKFFKKG